MFDGLKILVACNDTFHYVPQGHFESMAQFMLDAAPLINDGKVSVLREHNTIIDNGRSKIAWDAVNKGYTHLYFVDGDMSLSLSDLQALVARNVHVVSGTYFMRGHHVKDGQRGVEFPCVATRNGKYITREEIKRAAELGDMIGVHGVGGGSLLVTTEALKAIGQPAFKFNWNIGGNFQTKQGEDEWFSIQARNAGYTVWLDPCVRPLHYGFMQIGFDVADGNGYNFYTPSY